MTAIDQFEAWWKSEIPMSLESMETEDRFKADFKRCYLAAYSAATARALEIVKSNCGDNHDCVRDSDGECLLIHAIESTP